MGKMGIEQCGLGSSLWTRLTASRWSDHNFVECPAKVLVSRHLRISYMGKPGKTLSGNSLPAKYSGMNFASDFEMYRLPTVLWLRKLAIVCSSNFYVRVVHHKGGVEAVGKRWIAVGSVEVRIKFQTKEL